MADNVTANSGSGGAVFATDDVSGVHYPIQKLAYGALDSVTLVSSSAGLPVAQQGTWNIGTVTTVTTVSTVTAVTTVSTVTAVSDAQVQGKAAHDAAASGNPVLLGGYAGSAEPIAVANADVARLLTDLVGKLVTRPHCLPESQVSGTGNTTGTGDTAVIAAQGAGVRLYITSLIIHNASTTDTFVNIKDGSTTKLVVPAPAKGGAILSLDPPLRLTANAALNFASSTGVTTMYVSANGYTGV